MYKTVGISVLVLATFAFTSGSRSADASPSGLPSPLIVARGKVLNQNQDIPTTTIFTPPVSGLYRISAYLTVTSSVLAGADHTFNLNWSDDAGAEAAADPLFVYGNQTPPSAYGTSPLAQVQNPGPGVVLTFQSVANVPVTYSVFGGSPSDGCTYSLYYVVERLE